MKLGFVTLLLTLYQVHGDPATIEDGELVPASVDSKPSPIDPSTSPRPDVTKFLKKCRAKCDNLNNLPSYMDNHATSEEHWYVNLMTPTLTLTHPIDTY